MKAGTPILVWRCGEQRYALPLPSVERVVRMVEVTQIPGLPSRQIGVVDVAGRITPVLNAAEPTPWPGANPEHQLILASTESGTVAVWAEQIIGVTPTLELVAMDENNPFIDCLLKTTDGIALVPTLNPASTRINGKPEIAGTV